jgi:hypothetical protein
MAAKDKTPVADVVEQVVSAEEAVVESSAVQLVGDAARAAQVNGEHATHAVLDDLHQTLHVLRGKLDSADSVIEGEAADLLAKLRALL